MTTLNIIASIITILSLIFSILVYFDSKRKELVEKQRFSSYSNRLFDLLNMAVAIDQQARLIGGLTEREETSKKELKHLAVAQLSTINIILKSLDEQLKENSDWRFGVPSVYLNIEPVDDVEKRHE